MSKNEVINIDLAIYDHDTKYFISRMISLPKLPILIHGGLSSGKTTLMKFFAEIFIISKRKILVLADSTEREAFEFLNFYKVLWILPAQLKGCYLSKHPHLRIEYVNIEKYERIFKLISYAKEEVIVCTQFFPLLVDSFNQEFFREYFPHFPECVIFIIELSALLKARRFMDSKNIASGDLLHMVRHCGTNGFNLLADLQALEDTDIYFRRTGGIIFVFKKQRLTNTNPIHVYIRENFPEVAREIKTLPKTEFFALIDDKIYHCSNTPPSFYQEEYNWSDFFTVNTAAISFKEIRERYRAFEKAMALKLNPEKKKSLEDLIEEAEQKLLPDSEGDDDE